MRKEVQQYHMDTIALHNNMMFEDLLYEEDLSSNNLLEIEFSDYAVLRGYFATKNRTKYFIDQKILKALPIRINPKQVEELIYKENVVYRPTQVQPFKIVPAMTFKTFREFVDSFIAFVHTHTSQWTLLKVLAITSQISKIFVCIASNPEFGKSSIFDILHGITDKCPVFKPRSVPGVLNKINSVGNIVFDDTLEAKKEVREIMEEFSLQIAGGKAVYLNGAMKSGKTKNRYNCQNQSITYCYNTIDCYENPAKNYFESFFENKKAIDTRFLKLKLNGKLTEDFSKDFDLKKCAETNKMLYVNIAKYLLWLQEEKMSNNLKHNYTVNTLLSLKGRHKNIYTQIADMLGLYCNNQQEFDKYIGVLDQSIIDYREMINDIHPNISDGLVQPPHEVEQVDDKVQPMVEEMKLIDDT